MHFCRASYDLSSFPRKDFSDYALRSRKQVRALSWQLWSMAASWVWNLLRIPESGTWSPSSERGRVNSSWGGCRVKAFCSFLKRLWCFRTSESQNSHAASPGPGPQPCLQSTGEVGDARARGGRREDVGGPRGGSCTPETKAHEA